MPELGPLARLRAELVRDEKAASALMRELAARQDQLRDDEPVVLGYFAVTLHQLYTAVETMCERVCRTFEGELPQGAESHLALLRDMALDLPRLRPPMLRESTVDALRPLLRFRHFVRHAYAVAWDPARLREIWAGAQLAWPLFVEDVSAFATFLDGVIAAQQGGSG